MRLKLKFGAIRGVVRGVVIFGMILGQNKTPDCESCEWVISYIYISLYYVSLQVNKICYIFQIWVWDECEMFGLVMWILMGSVRGRFLDDRIAENAWFYWEKMGICKEIFWIFYEDFLRKFCDFWSSSIEALFYKGLRDFEGVFDDF